MTVVLEVNASLQLTAAVLQLRSPATKIIGRKIVTISYVRVGCFIAVQIMRMAVAISLAYGGT